MHDNVFSSYCCMQYKFWSILTVITQNIISRIQAGPLYSEKSISIFRRYPFMNNIISCLLQQVKKHCKLSVSFQKTVHIGHLQIVDGETNEVIHEIVVERHHQCSRWQTRWITVKRSFLESVKVCLLNYFFSCCGYDY
jgi:hypothetical protein